MVNRIDITLAEIKKNCKIALAPFVTVGYPDIETSIDIAESVILAGGDLLELGIPFSDPLAEGITIQKSSFQALRNGVKVSTCLDMVRRLRGRGIEAPLLLMGYVNPIFHYGQAEFIRDSVEVGVDALIVPDLPTEEATELRDMCEKHELWLVPLLAPTSTDSHIMQACKRAKGFIYCQSFTGVTGARDHLGPKVRSLVTRIRRHTDLPVLVGFGVSQRVHVQEIGGFADGAIVGSALIDAVDQAPLSEGARAAGDFIRRLKSPDNAPNVRS